LFASLPHVETLPLSQKGPLAAQTVGLHAQSPVAPLQVWCVPHVVVPALKTQLSLSFWQFAEAPLPLMQMFPVVEPQVASTLHVHTDAPAVGVVQAWRAPHATATSA
jgi:hypothetical protein